VEESRWQCTTPFGSVLKLRVREGSTRSPFTQLDMVMVTRRRQRQTGVEAGFTLNQVIDN